VPPSACPRRPLTRLALAAICSVAAATAVSARQLRPSQPTPTVIDAPLLSGPLPGIGYRDRNPNVKVAPDLPAENRRRSSELAKLIEDLDRVRADVHRPAYKTPSNAHYSGPVWMIWLVLAVAASVMARVLTPHRGTGQLGVRTDGTWTEEGRPGDSAPAGGRPIWRFPAESWAGPGRPEFIPDNGGPTPDESPATPPEDSPRMDRTRAGPAGSFPDVSSLASIRVFRRFEPGVGGHATFLIGSGGLWLDFQRDGLLVHPDDLAAVMNRQPTDSPLLLSASTQLIRAGELIRVVAGGDPADGSFRGRTFWADGGIVHVSEANAAIDIDIPPDCGAMCRAFERSADDLAFWEAILAAPDDDLPRLVYADWLDERGDPAAAFLRDGVVLKLRYSVSVSDVWLHRNHRSAGWHLAVAQFREFAAQWGYRCIRAEFADLALTRPVDPWRQRPGREEWQCLSLMMESGERLPAFVNYLLIQSALAPWVNRLRLAEGASVSAA
jgi:uncharacterized protein (TIGR02996 family)